MNGRIDVRAWREEYVNTMKDRWAESLLISPLKFDAHRQTHTMMIEGPSYDARTCSTS